MFCDLSRGNEPGINTKGLCVFKPFSVGFETLIGIGEIERTAALESHFSLDPLIHRSPSFQRLHDQRDFSRIPSLLATPAPVAGRLFGTDLALFAEGDRYPSFGEGECRTDPNDAAANDDDVCLFRGERI